MGLSEVIDEIHRLEHFHTLACSKCQEPVRYHVLQIYAACPKCNAQHKVRSFGGRGTEIQDVIDAVLEWAGDGENFEAVMKRHGEIRKDKDA
jgi:hypothetical protein